MRMKFSFEFWSIFVFENVSWWVKKQRSTKSVNKTSSSDLDLHYKVVELAEIYNFVVEVEV